MTILSIFAVRDSAADTFGNPFVVQHVGIALRSFQDEVNNPREGNMLHYHSKDFTLYELGTYDQATGLINRYDIPKQISHASSLKNPVQTQE